MAESTTTIRTSTGPRWGASGFTSSTAALKVGRSGTASYRGRIGFPSVADAVSEFGNVTSIKLYMNRTDEYSSKVLEIGICASSAWSPTFDHSKDISVTKGTGSKNWDLTSWASTILSYAGTWYLHVRHGSGTNSYCEFHGGTTGSCPRLIVVCDGNTLTIDLDGTEDAFTIGSRTGITVTGNITNGTYSLDYTMGSESGSIGSGITSGHLVDWTPCVELCSQFDTSITDTVTIIATGYDANNAQQVQSEYHFPISLPNDYAPGINSVTPIPENTFGDDEQLVQNFSVLRFDVDAEAKYGADIVRYDVTLCNKSYTAAAVSDIVTDVLSEAGEFAAIVSVTDSRGSTVVEEIPVVVLVHGQPVITDVALFRADSNGSPLESGTYLGYCVKGLVSMLDGTHPCAVTLQWKSPDEDEYDQNIQELDVAEDTSVESEPNVFYFVAAGELNISLEAGALDVRVTLEDGVRAFVQEDRTLLSRSVVFDILADGNGLAVGKTAELENSVDFGYDVRFRNDVQFDVAPTFADSETAISTLKNSGIRVGTFSISRSTWSADANYTYEVTFDTALETAPSAVLVGFMQGGARLDAYSVGTTGYTATGFTFNIARNAARSNATFFTLVYIAI